MYAASDRRTISSSTSRARSVRRWREDLSSRSARAAKRRRPDAAWSISSVQRAAGLRRLSGVCSSIARSRSNGSTSPVRWVLHAEQNIDERPGASGEGPSRPASAMEHSAGWPQLEDIAPTRVRSHFASSSSCRWFAARRLRLSGATIPAQDTHATVVAQRCTRLMNKVTDGTPSRIVRLRRRPRRQPRAPGAEQRLEAERAST